jgi:hypothetical protein
MCGNINQTLIRGNCSYNPHTKELIVIIKEKNGLKEEVKGSLEEEGRLKIVFPSLASKIWSIPPLTYPKGSLPDFIAEDSSLSFFKKE